MNELNELFEKYNLLLEKSTNYLKDFLNNFPELDLSSDILSQLSRDKLKRLEYMIPKLELFSQDISMVKSVFDYYYLNSDLNLSDLIIQDESYENFIQFIKNIYLKALKYKRTETFRIEKEQEKYKGLLNAIKNIKEIFNKENELDITSLVNYLKELPLTRDAILEITTMALERNLRLYQKLKVTKEVEQEEQIDKENIRPDMVDYDFDYQQVLNFYPRKILDFINSLERDDNHQDEKYEILAKAVILKDKLTEVKQDYDFCMQNPEYFKNDIPELLIRIKKIVMAIDEVIEMYDKSMNVR